MIIIIRKVPENKPVEHRQTMWGCAQIKRGLLGFKVPDWQTVGGIWGTADVQPKHFLPWKERKRKMQCGKDCIVAESLGSSGLISWLCSGFSHNLGQSQFISLCCCSSIITWISPLQHYPLSFSSICLTCWDYKFYKVPTASDFWFLSAWIWLSLIWFVSVCTVSSNLKQSLWMIP